MEDHLSFHSITASLSHGLTIVLWLQTSVAYGWGMFPGDDEPLSQSGMTTMLTLIKDKIMLEDYCVFLIAVVPEMIGACFKAMESAGVANTGDKNRFRVITWHKPGKFQKGRNNALPSDTEFYATCVWTPDGIWPDELFFSWFNQPLQNDRPGSSVVEVLLFQCLELVKMDYLVLSV